MPQGPLAQQKARISEDRGALDRALYAQPSQAQDAAAKFKELYGCWPNDNKMLQLQAQALGMNPLQSDPSGMATSIAPKALGYKQDINLPDEKHKGALGSLKKSKF